MDNKYEYITERYGRVIKTIEQEIIDTSNELLYAKMGKFYINSDFQEKVAEANEISEKYDIEGVLINSSCIVDLFIDEECEAEAEVEGCYDEGFEQGSHEIKVSNGCVLYTIHWEHRYGDLVQFEFSVDEVLDKEVSHV
jgi:hypothetical protein